MSVNSDKLQLWLDRYKVTAREYYDRILSRPNVRITSDFYIIIQELLTGNVGEQFIFLYNSLEGYSERTIYRFSEGVIVEESAIWTLPEGEPIESFCFIADETNIYVFNNSKVYIIEIETSGFETIELSGYTPDPGELVTVSGVYISDGISDMYDVGNFINTNHTAIWEDIKNMRIRNVGDLMVHSIPYTHTLGETSTTPQDGTDYFGTGSQYLTSKLDRCFFLGATNTDVTEFNISGEIGADGNGQVTTTTFVKGEYKVFVKMVIESGDPAIHQIIIVKDSSENISQYTPTRTESDDHRIYNLNSPSEIYFLLLGNGNSEGLTYGALDALTTSFLGLVGVDLETTATNFANNFPTILDNYENLVAFSDEGTSEETINATPQITPVEILNGDAGTFTLFNNDGYLFAIASDGTTEISPFRIPVQIEASCLAQNNLLVISSDYILCSVPDPYTVTEIGELIPAEEIFSIKIIEILSFINVDANFFLVIFGLNLDEDSIGTWLCQLNIETGTYRTLQRLPDIFLQLTPVITT